MKVLKKGKWRSFQICPECDAELLLSAPDVRYHAPTQNTGGAEYYSYDCPECGERHKLDSKNIPEEVRKLAATPQPRPPFVPSALG